MTQLRREGSLEAPERHPIDWQNPAYYDETALHLELGRVFDICHGCRRCFNLCNAFPTLFDLIDDSSSMEVDSVDKNDYWRVVDECYLCDLCFMTKCPYVPPHEWCVDFPHLMLRAKAIRSKQGKTKLRDRLLSSTDFLGRVASAPLVSKLVNWMNSNRIVRALMERLLGIHRAAWIPRYENASSSVNTSRAGGVTTTVARNAGRTQGKVAIFETCYGRTNQPSLAEDLSAILEHNGIPVRRIESEKCCGMPKLELGALDKVAALKGSNIPELHALVREGWDILAPIPSCVLMFKQELPLMFPEDDQVQRVRDAVFDPFEYLMLRHQAGLLNTSFRHSLGLVDYHVACHLRVQNIGLKTKEVLELVPDTRVDAIERCSGHDGTYAVKVEFHSAATKIGRPVVKRIREGVANTYASDCPMAGAHLAHGLGDTSNAEHPLHLLRHAYGC